MSREVAAVPSYRVSAESAYLIAIYLQTVAKAVEDQRPEECARWYSLMLRSPLQQLDSGLLAHAARFVDFRILRNRTRSSNKTLCRTLAMRYIESKDLGAAAEILRACAEEGGDARTDILRSHLAALQDDTLRGASIYPSTTMLRSAVFTGGAQLSKLSPSLVLLQTFRRIFSFGSLIKRMKLDVENSFR